MALAAQGEAKAAVTHFARALELNPDIPLALNGLARIRATHPDAELRNGAQAVELAERCCRLTEYRAVTALTTLAAAYAEAGHFDDAVKWQTKAIELSPLHRKADAELRLRLYSVGNTYRSGD